MATNHGARWTAGDDKTLMTLHNTGKSFTQIASTLHRTLRSIQWRLNELRKTYTTIENEDKITQNDEYQELTTQQISRLKVGDIIAIVIDINEYQSEMDEDMQWREFKIMKISGTILTTRWCTINGQRRRGRMSIDTDSFIIYRKAKTEIRNVNNNVDDNLNETESTSNTIESEVDEVEILNDTKRKRKSIQTDEPLCKKRKLIISIKDSHINVRNWELDECISWIHKVKEKYKLNINVDELYHHFKEEEFNGESLTLIEISDLKRFGMTSFNTMKRITIEARKLKY
eukprot:243736_1